MTRSTLRMFGGLFVLFAGLTGCVKPTQLTVPLTYRPTDRLELTGFNNPANAKVAVVVTDDRSSKTAIGVNQEDASKPIPIYAGTPDPATFLADGVKRELSSAGLSVVDDPAQATKVVKLSLVRFWVEETSNYRTEVQAQVSIAGKSGGPLWEGRVNGTNDRFGRSLEAENYQEALSDATVKLVQNLLGNPGVQKALQ